MTEAEWLASATSDALLIYLGDKRNKRKSRLLACACCRRMGEHIPEAYRAMLATAERYADREAKKGELPCRVRSLRAGDHAASAVLLTAHKHGSVESLRLAMVEALCVISANGRGRHYSVDSLAAEKLVQAALIRDIFGNPFRPAAFSPDWRTDTVTTLAKQMYAARDFSAMPILADALQDAGCDSDDILEHCRSDGLHARGCWVIDLVLGKE